MNVVLGTAPETCLSKMYLPSCGLLYLAKSLEMSGFSVSVVDSTIEGLGQNQLDDAADKVLSSDPAVVGFTGNTHNRFNVMGVLERIKQKAPHIVTVAGGPHFGIRHVAEDMLKYTSFIDVLCVGEGEFPMRELCAAVKERRDFSGIAGLVWKNKKDEIIRNPQGRLISSEEMDMLGMPSWHLIDHSKCNSILEGGIPGTRAVGLKTTRGCPYACSFCENVGLGQRKVRKRTPRLVVDEIEFLMKEYGYNAIDFWDDTFTVVPEHAYEVCDEILRRKLNFRWYARSTIFQPHRDKGLFKKMREAGCVALGVGVESGNQEIQRRIHAEGKNVNSQVIKETVHDAAALGMKVKCFFIYGHPGETPETLKQTLDFIDELNSMHSLVSAGGGIMRIYPGTELEDIARVNGSIGNDFSWNKYVEFDKSRLFCTDKTLPFFEDKMTIEEIKGIIAQHKMRSMSLPRKFKKIFRVGIKYAVRMHNKEDISRIGKMVRTFFTSRVKVEAS